MYNPMEEYNYHGDARVQAAHRSKFYTAINVDAMTLVVEFGEDQEAELPFTWQVCGLCAGAGKHVDPNVDCCGISPEEFADDPGFSDDYFGGRFDIKCNECSGDRVVPVVNEDACHRSHLGVAYLRWQEHMCDEASYEAERIAERRMGA